MKINKKHINKYYDKRASCQVLGNLMLNPKLTQSREFAINEHDFVTPLHQTLYMVIYNLSIQGIGSISLSDVETYLANNDVVAHARMFTNGEGAEWIASLLEDTSVVNYPYYHGTVRKFSYLRKLMEKGQDVSSLLDMEEVDLKALEIQREKFEYLTLDDIIKYFDKLHIEVKEQFSTRGEESARKVGEGARELRAELKEDPDFGFGYSSKYLNTISRGLRKGTFTIQSQDTGTGKSRDAVEHMISFTVRERWCHEKKAFVKNKFFLENESSLYIGTELCLYKEVELMAWAFTSGVEENKIKENNLTQEEEERIDKAIEILEQSNFFMEDEANYDLTFLWSTIERYKVKHNISMVAIDYLEGTAGILSEYAQKTRGMASREDQALLNLSKNIKEMARKFDVGIIGYTQVNNESRRDHTIRDAGCIKGSTSISNKADLGLAVFEPTKKELEWIEPLINKARRGLQKTDCIPNAVTTVYKNRGGKIKNVKIWAYIDLGTMEYIDLFVTNLNYEPMNIDKTDIIIKSKSNNNSLRCDENGEIIETMYQNTHVMSDDDMDFLNVAKEEPKKRKGF